MYPQKCKNPSFFFGGGRLNCLTLRKIILLKTVKGFCCLMQEIKNGIDRTHQKLFSRKLYNPYTVFYHTFFDLKLVYEVGPESFLPPPTVKSALLNIKRKHLFFDFKFKAKYLAFISCLLEKPDLSVKTALKSIFRKSQVRSISEKFGLNLNAQIVCLSPSQWLNCFLEMLEVVPEKFHPS